jgi:Na+-driven multidrug efflux pump
MKQNAQLLGHTFRGYSAKMTISYLMGTMGSIVDSIVISRFLGTDAMAAFQIIMPIILLNVVVGSLFSLGLQTSCANCLGAGRVDEASRIYTVAMLAMTPIALLFAVGVGFFAGPLASMLCGPESAALAGGAAAYLRGVAPALGLNVFIPTLTCILFLEGKSKTAIAGIGAELAVNIAGDLAIAFWLPHWGLLGMGLATSLCNVAGVAVMVGGKIASKGGISLTRAGLSVRHVWTVLAAGTPSALNRFYVCVQTLVTNHLLLTVATGTGVAIFGILGSMDSIFTPVVLGIAASGLTIGGVLFGERDKDGLCTLFSMTLAGSVLAGVAIAAAVTAFAPPLVSLFKPASDPAFDATVHALRIYIWYCPFYAINKMLRDFYLACGTTRMSYLICTLENLVFTIVAVVVLGRLFGADGVWWGIVAGEALTVAAMAVVIAAAKKRIPRRAEDMLFLNPLMDTAKATTREWSATTFAAVNESAAEARDFMISLGAPEADADLMGRFIEEVGSVTTRWAAARGLRLGDALKKPGPDRPFYLDIRLVGIPPLSPDFKPLSDKMATWKLRLRDNGHQFDLKEWGALHDGNDPIKNPAIHAMTERSPENSYSYTLGLNYLFITL